MASESPWAISGVKSHYNLSSSADADDRIHPANSRPFCSISSEVAMIIVNGLYFVTSCVYLCAFCLVWVHPIICCLSTFQWFCEQFLTLCDIDWVWWSSVSGNYQKRWNYQKIVKTIFSFHRQWKLSGFGGKYIRLNTCQTIIYSLFSWHWS
jgi:hypothetical protein